MALGAPFGRIRRLGMAAAGAACAGMLAVASARAAEDTEFDVSAFEKKPFEWNGYLELKPEYQRLDRGSALYGLQFPGDTRASLPRLGAAAELSGIYRHDDVRLHFTGHGSYVGDPRGSTSDLRLYEGYAAWQPAVGTTLEAGKRTLRWGKGYAWSPVAFFERAKDPTDPELSREGFVMATGSLVRSFSGPLKTMSLTPVLLPVNDNLNDDYGRGDHSNPGAKLYALLYDTDVDLVYAGAGSRSGARWGADFSRNLGTNLEVHGEWARVSDAPQVVLTPVDTLATQVRSYTSYLLGLRYLTERETTIVLEYYRNGSGYTQDQAHRFFELAHTATASPMLRAIAAQAANGGYVGPNPMRNYLYLRLSQPEPFDILYFTPALTAIVNTDDRSYTLIPELLYTGITNLELRFRFQLNRGDRLTDYGEKAVDSRVELRMRLFF
jgi:hypothetical protein